jgi:hypothetical protein
MAGFQRFGFGGSAATVNGASLADHIKVNQQVLHLGGGVFEMTTLPPGATIVPNTLKVSVNGANQTPALDFNELPGGRRFAMLDAGINWSSAQYSIVVDFIRT